MSIMEFRKSQFVIIFFVILLSVSLVQCKRKKVKGKPPVKEVVNNGTDTESINVPSGELENATLAKLVNQTVPLSPSVNITVKETLIGASSELVNSTVAESINGTGAQKSINGTDTEELLQGKVTKNVITNVTRTHPAKERKRRPEKTTQKLFSKRPHRIPGKESEKATSHTSVEQKPFAVPEKESEKTIMPHKLVEKRPLKVPEREIEVPEVINEPEKEKERIVTEFMLLRKGVSLDYTYNESASLPGEIVSAPGCPKSIDGYPWVLYGDEPKCYLVGQHSSVCEGSSVMSYQKSSYYGVCGCNFQDCIAKHSDAEVKGYQLLRRIMSSSSSRYTFCQPPNVFCEEYVYDRKEKRCHILYSQGPCGDNEWLQRDGKGGVECAPRLCPNGKGLTVDSEKMLLARNLTEERISCCKPWGGFAVRLSGKKTECKNGESYSEVLQKCVVMPFKASSLVIG